MSAIDNSELTAVLDQIRDWSPASKIVLARRILETLDRVDSSTDEERPTDEAPTRGWPVERVLGLLRTDRQPPDDEECRRIIEEARARPR